MSKFYKEIGLRIKEIREDIGISQDRLAKLMNIQRVSVSKIENGQRKITAQELAKLTKIFNTDSDVLLDLKKDVKIVMKKNKKPLKITHKEIRINVPLKNLDKFKEVVLYILGKVGSKPNIGQSVIYKLLYFIDFNFYEKYEEQLIGATYIRNHYGPTPKEFIKIVKDMQGKDIIKVEDKYFEYPQTKYLPLRKPDLTKLRAHEKETIDNVLEKLSDMNAAEISDYSHKDVPWITTDEGGIIDYESVFYRTAPYSVRSYGEEKNI